MKKSIERIKTHYQFSQLFHGEAVAELIANGHCDTVPQAIKILKDITPVPYDTVLPDEHNVSDEMLTKVIVIVMFILISMGTYFTITSNMEKAEAFNQLQQTVTRQQVELNWMEEQHRLQSIINKSK